MNNELVLNEKTLDSREVAEMMNKSHGAVLKMLQGSKDGKSIGIMPTLEKSNFDLSKYFIETTGVYHAGNTLI